MSTPNNVELKLKVDTRKHCPLVPHISAVKSKRKTAVLYSERVYSTKSQHACPSWLPVWHKKCWKQGMLTLVISHYGKCSVVSALITVADNLLAPFFFYLSLTSLSRGDCKEWWVGVKDNQSLALNSVAKRQPEKGNGDNCWQMTKHGRREAGCLKY